MTRQAAAVRPAAVRPAAVRLTAAAAALLTVAAGLVVTYAGSGPVAKPVGDCLYTVLLHTLIVAAAPRVRPLPAAGLAFALSAGVELAQLTGLPAALAGRSTLARLVLGTTFNAPDLLWYAAGAALAAAAHAALAAAARRRRGGQARKTPTDARFGSNQTSVGSFSPNASRRAERSSGWQRTARRRPRRRAVRPARRSSLSRR
ncbi:DUF2809 domain-containing protein [Kitasatospora terrestris]|uniref:ribosomal maturation YjgA family protein n=1 Tax=Kitasatospora terrestris TaxID=258051 RepID=UPI0031E5A1C9